MQKIHTHTYICMYILNAYVYIYMYSRKLEGQQHAPVEYQNQLKCCTLPADVKKCGVTHCHITALEHITYIHWKCNFDLLSDSKVDAASRPHTNTVTDIGKYKYIYIVTGEETRQSQYENWILSCRQANDKVYKESCLRKNCHRGKFVGTKNTV